MGYLQNDAGASIAEEDRGLLEQLLLRARATMGSSCEGEEQWADPFTLEEVTQAGLIGIAAGAGFAAAYLDSAFDSFMLLAMAPQDQTLQIAEGVGYVAGIS